MKKFSIVFFTIFLIVSNFYAQPKPVNEWYWVDKQSGTNKDNKTELLTGIDMVTITNVPTKYVIGENTQSFTAKVTVPAYEMNKYETTFQLWYKVLQKVQETAVQEDAFFEKVDEESFMKRQDNLNHLLVKPEKYELFWSTYKTGGFDAAIRKAGIFTVYGRLRANGISLLKKLGIYSLLKR
mgnify:CR=1 FL=1